MSSATLPAVRNGAAPAPTALEAGTLESLIVKGDLSKLTETQRISYYRARCESLGLDPTAQPFSYLVLNGKLILYANKGCSDQLTGQHKLTVQIVGRETINEIHVVQCRVTFLSGRYVEDCGAVPVGNLRGEALANALMKATTKAKRRAVLSALGLGMLDESEVDSIPGAVPVHTGAPIGSLPGDPPPRDSSLPSGGSPRDDQAYLDWCKGYTRRCGQRWTDYWTRRMGQPWPDAGGFLPEYQLSGHLAKWLGATPGIIYNHRLRLLAIAYRDDPKAMEAEARRYVLEKFREAVLAVEAKHGLDPEFEAEEAIERPLRDEADPEDFDAPDGDPEFADERSEAKREREPGEEG